MAPVAAAASPVLFGTAATGTAAATAGLIGSAGAFSLGTTIGTLGTLASGVSAVRTLTGGGRSSAPTPPTLTAPTAPVSDTPQTKVAQVDQVRQQAQDQARRAATQRRASQQTNLTSGLTLRQDSEEESGTGRAKRTALGV